MQCPSVDALAAFFDGTTHPSGESWGIDAHVDECPKCRLMVGELASMAAAGREGDGVPTADWLSPDVPARGVSIGRYVVLDFVGAGSMGVVVSAYDPKIDRKVALKILRPAADPSGGEGDPARMLREAQSIARVSHPNVIAIHDVGTHEGRVFLAMEFVEGETLTRWVAAEPGFRDVVRVFSEAGRGLAAAHEAGLVHRDFKPDNVLVAKTGVAKVADFGLARVDGGGMTMPRLGPEQGAALTITRAGTRIGTPAYMSPEQHRGEPATPQSDQFGFCVALWEALTGERPAAISAVDQRAAEASARSAKPYLPLRILRIVARGLRPYPMERHPTMRALVDALQDEPEKRFRRRVVVLAVAALASALASAAALSLSARASERRLLCSGASKELSGVWDAPRREAVESAFARTGLPYATHVAARATELLDAYAGTWATSHREACEATRLRGEQSEAMLDARMQCLERRLASVRSLTEMLSRAEGATVEHAVQAVQGLPSVAECSALRVHPTRASGGASGKIAFRALDRATASLALGRYEDARTGADEALTAARSEKDARAEAEALVTLGQVALRGHDGAAAEKVLFPALQISEREQYDTTEVTAALELARAIGGFQERPAEAEKWLAMASAVIDRTGDDDKARVEMHLARGLVLHRAGRFREAADEARAAVGLAERGGPSATLKVGEALNLLAAAAAESGDEAQADTYCERSLAIDLQELGPSHPRVAVSLVNLAVSAVNTGRFEDALDMTRRALAIYEGASAGAPVLSNAYGSVTEPLILLGRYGEAEEALGHALSLARASSVDSRRLAQLHALGGLLRRREKRYDEALREDQEALDAYRVTTAPDSPELATLLVEQGRAYLEKGLWRDALPPLLRAAPLLEADGYDRERAEARAALARALFESGRDPARARALAEKARLYYEANPAQEPYAHDLLLWLRQHGA